jgi:hypothetical protein
MTNTQLINRLAQLKPARSHWDKALQTYAIEILSALPPDTELPSTRSQLDVTLLNGARSWQQYSESGCSLVADVDIAERLLTPSQFRRWQPDSSPDPIKVQTRALHQAADLIYGAKFAYDNEAK